MPLAMKFRVDSVTPMPMRRVGETRHLVSLHLTPADSQGDEPRAEEGVVRLAVVGDVSGLFAVGATVDVVVTPAS
jgi:hypothetical protein